MKKPYQLWIAIILIAFLPLLSDSALAAGIPGDAGPPPPDGGGAPGCWPPPCIPIDGGIGFLVAAGLAYGGTRFFKRGVSDQE